MKASKRHTARHHRLQPPHNTTTITTTSTISHSVLCTVLSLAVLGCSASVRCQAPTPTTFDPSPVVGTLTQMRLGPFGGSQSAAAAAAAAAAHHQHHQQQQSQLPPIFGIHTQDIQDMILQYVDETLNRRTYQLLAGLTLIEKNQTHGPQALTTTSASATSESAAAAAATSSQVSSSSSSSARSIAAGAADASSTFDVKLWQRLTRFAETRVISVNVPRAVQATAKTFFFKSLKKVMWPLFIGLQVVKTMLLAMFLPSIIGSLGKIVGKGLSSVSGFGAAPAETIDNLEFKDNYNVNIDAEDPNYSYPQPGGMAAAADSVAHPSYAHNTYESAADANNALSRFGIGGNRVTYVNTGSDYGGGHGGGGGASAFGKKTDFKDFHDIPASSMLLTNYDPFYSPLLSRLDAVFQQMGLAAGNERCREKLVCLMYASPAKYAPYSNLVSAQLSRELNELKKPTTDNPDILRFFKYMRAAKDGQDQTNCAAAFAECESLKDTDSPAMLTTYNDINKLVQARNL